MCICRNDTRPPRWLYNRDIYKMMHSDGHDCKFIRNDFHYGSPSIFAWYYGHIGTLGDGFRLWAVECGDYFVLAFIGLAISGTLAPPANSITIVCAIALRSRSKR